LTAVDQRLDGNLPANQSTRSHTFVFAGDGLAVGDSFYLRFIDWNNTGTDSAMAIDNFTVTGTLVPEPTSAGMVALGLLSGGLIRRRRRA